MNTHDRRVLGTAEAAILATILALAAFLRLNNLPTNPGWYSDEGTLLNIASNLSQGRSQYLALEGSTLLAARMPIFPLLMSFFVENGSDDIGRLRTATALMGVASVGLLYLLLRRALGREGWVYAALSAGLLAIYPRAVLYSRIGFSYNLLVPLALITAFALWEYLRTGRRGWLIVAAGTTGIGVLSDIVMAAYFLPLLIVVAYRKPSDLSLCLVGLLAPGLAYGATGFALDPQAFLYDARFTASRLSAVPLVAQFPIAAFGIASLMESDPWIALGIAGLLALHNRRLLRLSILMSLLPLLLLARSTTGLASLGAYYILPILPFVLIGVARLLVLGAQRIVSIVDDALRDLENRWKIRDLLKGRDWGWRRLRAAVAAVVLFLLLLGPPAISTMRLVAQVRLGFNTAIDYVLVSPSDALAAGEFVNDHAAATDLVIASPALAWYLNTRVADFQQAIAFQGGKTEHFPQDIPPERFAYPAGFEDACLVVTDRIWWNWAAKVMPEVRASLERIDDWPRIFEQGEFVIFANPEVCPPTG